MSNETSNDTPTADTKLSDIQAPPTTILGILKKLGPGLIIAGSIVGSGELIATTSTGAQAGFWLLWLIIIGCVPSFPTLAAGGVETDRRSSIVHEPT